MATLKRTSFCTTPETQRQLDELCTEFGENKSQVIIRAIQLLHFSLRYPTMIGNIKEDT